MNFAVGQKWGARNGVTIEIERTDYPSEEYPIFGRVVASTKTMRTTEYRLSGMTFNRQGIQVEGVQGDYDLIKLISPVATNTVISPVSEVTPIVAPVAILTPRQVNIKIVRELIEAGHSAKPKHEGGYGENMVYITPEMYSVLENVTTYMTYAPTAEKVRKVELERDVFRAVLEGMGFENLDEMVQQERAAYHARALGRELLKSAKAIQVGLEKVSK